MSEGNETTVHNSSQALLRIYDAVANPSVWDAALDSIVNASGCRSAVLSVTDMAVQGDADESSYELTAMSHVLRSRPEVLEEYFAIYGQQEASEFAFILDSPKLQIVEDSFVWPDIVRMKGRDDFRFRLENFGVFRRCAVRLDDNRRWVETAFFQMDAIQQDIPAVVKDRILAFVPHMAKAVELGRTFLELKRRYRAVFGVLNKVKIGLALVRKDGVVVLANEEAERIIDQSSSIRMSNSNKLEFFDEIMTGQLARGVIGAINTAEGQNDIAEFKVSIKNDPKGHTPESAVFIEVSPIRDTFEELGSNTGYALLTLIEPNELGSISINRLALAYRLSLAESAICTLLVQGRTHGEIADIRGVSVETVKSQSKRILQKTGTHSRSELIKLALRISPPIEL